MGQAGFHRQLAHASATAKEPEPSSIIDRTWAQAASTVSDVGTGAEPSHMGVLVFVLPREGTQVGVDDKLSRPNRRVLFVLTGINRRDSERLECPHS